MRYTRDPISEWWDGPAVALLRRAYEQPGKWTGVYQPAPSQGNRLLARAAGVQLGKRDKWGENRWTRSFKRAIYWNFKQDMMGVPDDQRPALEYRHGPMVKLTGQARKRQLVEVRVMAGGPAVEEAYAKLARRRKAFTREPALQSTIADRDWEG